MVTYNIQKQQNLSNCLQVSILIYTYIYIYTHTHTYSYTHQYIISQNNTYVSNKSHKISTSHSHRQLTLSIIQTASWLFSISFSNNFSFSSDIFVILFSCVFLLCSEGRVSRFSMVSGIAFPRVSGRRRQTTPANRVITPSITKSMFS